jgi:hypothetical protein
VWRDGILHQPTYVLKTLALLRVEYPMFPEPPFIKDFRKHFGEAELANFTWVPQPDSAPQQLFIRRNYIGKSFDLEYLLWDRVDNQYTRAYFTHESWGAMLGVLADLTMTYDPHRHAKQRQERRALALRNAVEEDGSPAWAKVGESWERHEAAFVRERREAKSRVRETKGLPPLERG